MRFSVVCVISAILVGCGGADQAEQVDKEGQPTVPYSFAEAVEKDFPNVVCRAPSGEIATRFNEPSARFPKGHYEADPKAVCLGKYQKHVNHMTEIPESVCDCEDLGPYSERRQP